MSCIDRFALRKVSAGLALVFFTTQAVAAPIGEATQAKNEVTGQLGTVAQQISVGSGVSSNETVRTGTSSSTELRFLDSSTLNIGAASAVVLDRHIYDPNRGSVDTFVNLSKGALRFVSAGQRTRNASIGTPVATIGIRGTNLAVFCNDVPTCATMIEEGTARVCPFPPGTQVSQGLRNACQRGNEALLPCGYYDITAEDEQRDDDEGNYITIDTDCAVSQPQNVDPRAFNFLENQIFSGGVMPDPSQFLASFRPISPITTVGRFVIPGALVTIPAVTWPNADPMSP